MDYAPIFALNSSKCDQETGRYLRVVSHTKRKLSCHGVTIRKISATKYCQRSEPKDNTQNNTEDRIEEDSGAEDKMEDMEDSTDKDRAEEKQQMAQRMQRRIA